MNSNSIYTQIYDNLVNSKRGLKEQWEPTGSGLERHHIIPRHQGGSDDESNFTYLTLREHIAAHFLLWKINGHEGDRSAYKMMKGIKSYPVRLGVKHTEETKQRISKSKKGKKLTEEHKRRMSESMKKRYEDPAERAKQSEARKGKKRTEESKRKQSEAMKKRWAKKRAKEKI